MRKSNTKLFSLESILTQNDPKFTNKLDDLCIALLNAFRSNSINDKDRAGADIGELLSHRFGLKFTFIENSHIQSYIGVYVPCEDASIFNNTHTGIKFEDIVKHKPNVLGTVDTAKATVSGSFSSLPFSIYCNLEILLMAIPALSNRELAALILHEVGHAFSYVEYSDRMSLVNTALSDVHDLLVKGIDKKKQIYLLQDTIANLSGKEPKSTNVFVLSALVIKSIMNSYKAEMSKTTYRAAYEQVSDQFSARFGYGRELVSAVVGIDDNYVPNGMHYLQMGDSALRVMIYKTTLPSIYFYLAIITTWGGMAAGAPIIILSGILALALSIFIKFENTQIVSDDIYDHVFDRVNKIRQDYIQQLKDLQIVGNKKLIQDYVSAIDEFDSTVKILKDNQQEVTPSLLKKIQKSLFSHSEELSSFEAERIIESLTSNKLFVDSAKLKLLLTDEE